MKKFLYNRLLLIAIALGLIASLAIAFQRNEVETRNNRVDLVVDYDSLWNLAEREGIDFSTVLAKAKNAGITSLAIYETTLEKLTRQGRIVVAAGYDIIANYYNGTLADYNWRVLVEGGSIDPNRVYVVGTDPNVYAEAKDDIIRRIGTARINILPFGVDEDGNALGEVLELRAQYAPFLTVKLGIPTYELDIARNAGFMILARPSNYLQCKADDIRSTFARLDGFPISAVVFDGQQALGAPNLIDTTVGEMARRRLTLGLIEHVTQLQFYPQLGLEDLARGLGYDHTARLYAIPKDEQPKLPIETAVNRWATTDHERNIRINLLRIYDKPDGDMNLVDTNMKYFRDTAEAIKAKGFTLGSASTFDSYYPSRVLRALVVLGTAAAVVLYLSLISPRINHAIKFQLILFGVLAVVMIIPILIGAGGKVRLFAAFAAANLFPVLAVIWQLDRIRFMKLRENLRLRKLKGKVLKIRTPASIVQIILTAIFALLVTGAMSMVGAAYLSGALSDVEYFLEFNVYRGTKLTFILPLVLVAIAYLQRFNVVDDADERNLQNLSALDQIKKILDLPVRVKTFLGLTIVAVAFIILIARSGHTAGMPVPGIEVKFRAALENLFYARPRSKEILIGHPALMLGIMAFFKKWSRPALMILVIAATLGQSSMVETFAHMRTPIFMSFMRGIDGLIVGAVIGILPIVVVNACMRFKN